MQTKIKTKIAIIPILVLFAISSFTALRAFAVEGDAKCLKVNVPAQASKAPMDDGDCYIMPAHTLEGRTQTCIESNFSPSCYVLTCDLQPKDKCKLEPHN